MSQNAPPAPAPAPAPAAASDSENVPVQEVVVTGSRIPQANLTSTLNPNPAPDLNQIPVQLVERVEVVTGGASAVYGSDAIAGVVNFVMKHDFQGIQLDGQYGIDQHDNNNHMMQSLETQAGFAAPSGSTWDGQNRSFSVVMGTNFADDKGNIEAYFTYRNADPVSQGARDFSACELHVTHGTSNAHLLDTPFCDGSPNSNLIEPVANTNNDLTVVGNQLLTYPQAGSSPPGVLNSQPFAEQLTVGAAFRHSDYNTAGGVNTYKFDVEYAPVKDVMARFSFDRAIRAPNLIELFTPQSVTNTTVVGKDPCAGPLTGPNAVSASLAACEHTGVTAAEYGNVAQCPAGQCATLNGGNPKLAPERADTLSFGFTFTPTFLNNFTATIDYYRIQLAQEVGVVPQNITLNECLAGVTSFCSGVVRTPTGALFGTTIGGGGYVIATNQNIARAVVAGIDLQLDYRWDVGSFGSMKTAFTGTWLQHNTSQPIPTDPAYECSGLYGVTCQTVNPRWRHVARITWNTPYDVMLSAQWRFIGSVSLDNNTGNPLLATSAYTTKTGQGYDSFDAKLPNVSYLDLSAMYEVTKNLSVRIGVNNVLDKDPPVVNEYETTTGAPNTYPTYDMLGRQLYAASTAKF